MQTVLTPQSMPGANVPGPQPLATAAEGAQAKHRGSEDRGQDGPPHNAFSGYMAEALPNMEPGEEAAEAVNPAEGVVPAGAFWPMLAAGLHLTAKQAEGTLPTAPGQQSTTQTGPDPLLPDGKAVEVVVLSLPILTGSDLEPDTGLPAGLPFSRSSPAALTGAEQTFVVPYKDASITPFGPLDAVTGSDQIKMLDDQPGRAMAPVLATLPGLPAASVLQYWQAAFGPSGSGLTAEGKEVAPDTLLPKAEVPAASASVAPSPPVLATSAAQAALVAKLAETALQLMFTAQGEAEMTGFDDLAGFAVQPAVHTGPPGLGPPTVVQATALPQLAAQLVQALSYRADGTTEIALSPDELGHVRVTLQTDALNPDRLVVMLNFERPETLDLFRRNADQLAEALRDSGFTGADISFGRSDGGDDSDARPKSSGHDLLSDDRGREVASHGSNMQNLALRLVATGTLDLRL